MKKLIGFIWLCLAFGCHQEPLVDESKNDGRSTQEERTDTATVTPNFNTNDWEGSIDVSFGFG